MKRVLLVGCPGAGKSTLARVLGDRLGLPVVHLDAFYWLPGWVERPRDEFDHLLGTALQNDRWIIDGNYSRTIARRLAYADAVIFLDFPRWLCLWRVVKRWLRYGGRTRPDMGRGCPEKIDGAFLRWIWTYPTRSRPQVVQALQGQEVTKSIVILNTPGHVRRFLRDL